MAHAAVQDDVREEFESPSGELVEFEAEPEERTSIIPAPTMPAALTSTPRPEEQGGGGVMGIPNAYSGSRAESAQNKKPYALIKLGHLLCGFKY
ncbi:MAG TPA: hypothetical protein VHM89_00840 [Acidimicrobiales bacterium]|nr:hypothetical protein [Acidimicrobiales bacterium]